MEYLKKIGKSLLYTTLIIVIATFFITFLNYFNIINSKIVAIMQIMIILIATFVGGYLMGKVSKQKGWIEGIKLGGIIIVILALFNYLGLQQKFLPIQIIYYLILMISTTLGSMIGINRKKI